MPAATTFLRQASSRINAAQVGRQILKNRSMRSATSEMKQEPKRIKFYCGTQREKEQRERGGWIRAFCSRAENDLFVNVDEDFIKDNFNLHGLNLQVLDFDDALQDILGLFQGVFEDEAQMLYGLIHRRFILSSKGLDAMSKKFKRAEFQKCPRSCCEGQTCLPMGFSDNPGVATVMFFCPRCEDVFSPVADHHRDVDGAYFGPTFPHLLLMTHSLDVKPPLPIDRPSPSTSGYVPRIFGFRIHKPPHTAAQPPQRESPAASERLTMSQNA